MCTLRTLRRASRRMIQQDVQCPRRTLHHEWCRVVLILPYSRNHCSFRAGDACCARSFYADDTTAARRHTLICLLCMHHVLLINRGRNSSSTKTPDGSNATWSPGKSNPSTRSSSSFAQDGKSRLDSKGACREQGIWCPQLFFMGQRF